MIRLITVIFCISLVSCFSNKEDKEPKVNLETQKFSLSNGLDVILVQNNKLPLVAVRVYYHVGSKFEGAGITGSTHFLEHMMFKGSQKFGPGSFEAITDKNGGSNNAYTTNDLTVYHEDILIEDLEVVLEAEADRMQNLILEQKSFDSEKNIILEERKMRYENSPSGQLFYELMKEFFQGTPYGQSTIGKIEDIKSVTREQMMAHYKLFYAPNNATLVVSGDIDFSKTKKMIQDKFSSIPKSEGLEEFFRKYQKEKNYSIKWSGYKNVKLNGRSANPIFRLVFPGVAITNPKSFVLDLVSTIIGGLSSSYLNQKFVSGDHPLLSQIFAFNWTLMETGVFMIGGEMLHGANIDAFEKQLQSELKNICDTGLTEESLKAAKNSFLMQYLSGLGSNQERASFVGDREIMFGDYLFYKKEMDVYNSISLKEVVQECKEVLAQNSSLFISLWEQYPSK